MTTVLINYNILNKDVLSLIEDYMGENKYQLNYKKVMEEYKLKTEINSWNDEFSHIYIHEHYFNYRKLSDIDMYINGNVCIYNNKGYTGYNLPEDY